MLRIYFVQQFYNLADEALEDAVYDSQALRTFIGINLTREPVPDATTLPGFRYWLEANDYTQAIFANINASKHGRERITDASGNYGRCYHYSCLGFREKEESAILKCIRQRRGTSIVGFQKNRYCT